MPLPPLPSISPGLEPQVFTHKGLHGLPAGLRADDLGAPSNWERLAFLGDAVLQICTTEWLYSSFPGSRIGDLTRKRSQIVANKTLASWSSSYNLPQRIIAHTSTEYQLQTMPSNKVGGSLFEAFLGAVYLTGEDGPSNARRWINAILRSEFGCKNTEVDLELSSNTSVMEVEEELEVEVDTSGSEPECARHVNLRTTSPTPQVIDSGRTLSTESTDRTPHSRVNPVQKKPGCCVNFLGAFNERAFKKGLKPAWGQSFTGPEHQKTWEITLTVLDETFMGIGNTIREARNMAAKGALEAGVVDRIVITAT